MPQSDYYSSHRTDTDIGKIDVHDFAPPAKAIDMPRKILLTILSALLVTLVFPPVDWWFLAPVAWVPLFMALRDTGVRASFRLGVLHGLLSYGGTLWWMMEIFQTFAACLWFMLALFTGVFGLLFHLASRFQTRWLPLVLAMIWTGIEYYRGELFVLSFPWITPGTGFPPIELTSVIGVYGVSFLLVLIGLTYVLEIGQFRLRDRLSITLVSGLALLFLMVFVSMPRHEDTALTIALVQNEDGIFDTHFEFSEPHAGKVDAIVWPEYAIDFDPESHPRGIELQELLIGTTEVIILGARREGDDDDFQNTAFVEGKAGQLGSHVKNHTVHLFADGIPGTTADPIETPLGKIGTPICFDCDYQDIVRKMTASGAEFFLIPVMDAKSWTARQHLQHAELFRHRAAENGRWLAVAATSGRTQIISPEGQVDAQLPLMRDGVLVGQIRPLNHLTLFQRGGWLFGPLCLGATLLLSVIFSVGIWKNHRHSGNNPTRNSRTPERSLL